MKRAACRRMGLWLVVGILVAASTVWGDGFRNPPESASILGRIGGKLVHVDDASAVTLNPANMADMEQVSAMGTATFGYAKRTYDSPAGVHEESKDPWAVLPSAFAVMPVKDSRWVAGVGVTVPYGRFTDWGNDVIFGSSSPYYAEQSVINVNPSIATRLGDSVLIGAGVSLYQSSILFKQNYAWSAVTGDASTPSGDARFEGDGVAFGGNLALTWKINERHAVALTYRSPFDVEYEGDFDISNVPGEATAVGVTSSSDFETEIKYPTCVAAGYGVCLTDTVRVEFDVEWIEASRNEDLPLDLGNNNVLLPASSRSIPQNWNDNWTYGVGVDWQFTEKWIARAGYIYLETPTTTATTLPVASEEDQSVISVGLGYASEGHSFDIAYAIGLFDGLSVNDNAVGAVNGEYDFESHLFSAAYSRAF